MSIRIVQSLWRNGEGSALIEGAIVVPLLLILVLGVFEFSWLIDQQHLISTGVHDAARYIAQSANPSDLTTQKRAKNLATMGAIDGDTVQLRTRAVSISGTLPSKIRWMSTDRPP